MAAITTCDSEFDLFLGDDLHLKLLQAFPTKASVENSPAKSAIFYATCFLCWMIKLHTYLKTKLQRFNT